jgi:hypothetical protein
MDRGNGSQAKIVRYSCGCGGFVEFNQVPDVEPLGV